MILKYAHCPIGYNKKGATLYSCKRRLPIYEVICDCCGKTFIEKQRVFDKRLELINLEYCGQCSKPKMCSVAAYKGIYDADGNIKPNAGRFSTERVENMTPEEYELFRAQRKRAAQNFHDSLKQDAEKYKEHFSKIFKGSRIGYISKAQRYIHSILEPYGFELEVEVEGFRVDIANIEKKIVFEYYDDLWHANPRKYQPDDYIDIIKMTASEKWKKDLRRNAALRSLGYKVIIIWENKWNNERGELLERIGEYIGQDFSSLKTYSFDNVMYKQMHNIDLNKNKLVPIDEVQEHVSDGWSFGFKKKSKGCK